MKDAHTGHSLSEFEKNVGYSFKDTGLLSLALTHSSYANENAHLNVENNEKLEFLGDAVLELSISEYLYIRYPKLSEGELTKFRAGLVCEASLAKLSRRLSLSSFLLLGKGEEATGGRDRDSILADAFEAVIGAIYLDGGLDNVKTYVERQFSIEAVEMQAVFRYQDNKTYLQEELQKNGKEAAIYRIVAESGPAHNKKFTAVVEYEGRRLGEGSGKNKKEAEQNAALQALEKLKLK